MNVFSFAGNLGGDAELREIKDTSVLNFSVANNVGYGDNQKTLWVRCAVWGVRAEKLAPMLTKGTKVFISGQLDLTSYPKKDGGEGFSLDVKVNDLQLMGGGEESQDQSESAPARASGGKKGW